MVSRPSILKNIKPEIGLAVVLFLRSGGCFPCPWQNRRAATETLQTLTAQMTFMSMLI
jgi:hypothetical protein